VLTDVVVIEELVPVRVVEEVVCVEVEDFTQ